MPLSIKPVAVCIYGVPNISFVLSVLLTDLNSFSFPVEAVPFSALIVCGMLFGRIY